MILGQRRDTPEATSSCDNSTTQIATVKHLPCTLMRERQILSKTTQQLTHPMHTNPRRILILNTALSSHSLNCLCCDSPNNTPLWRLFSRTTASDEIFFPTLLSLLGLESYLVKKQITMVDWEGFTKNPRTYEKNQLNIAVKKGRDIGAMNVRKFRSVDMGDWCKIVLNSSSK